MQSLDDQDPFAQQIITVHSLQNTDEFIQIMLSRDSATVSRFEINSYL